MNPFTSFLQRLTSSGRRTERPTETLGHTGTVVYGGYPDTPESHADLQGSRRYKTFANALANVSIMGAGVRFFLNLVTKPSWKYEPANETPEAKRLAELSEEILGDMVTSWSRVIRKAAMYRFYGFSVSEWTAKRRADGVLGYLDVESRPQRTIERWDVDEHGRIMAMWQRVSVVHHEIFLPRQKLLYLLDDSLSDSPEGLGIFRHTANAAKNLMRYEQLEGVGFETDLRGIPIGRAPYALLQQLVKDGHLSEADAKKYTDPIESFIKKHIVDPTLGLTLDSATYQAQDDAARPSNVPQFSVELLKGDSRSFADVAKAIERLERQIARGLGVENLLLPDNTGSQALSQDKSFNFALTVDSSLREMREQVGHDLLRPLFRLNGWPVELVPTVKTDAIQFRDVTDVTQALVDLARAGAPLDPMDPAIEEVRDLLGLSKPAMDQFFEDAALMGGSRRKPQSDSDPLGAEITNQS